MTDKEYFADSSDIILWQVDPDFYLPFSFVTKVFLYGAHQRLINMTLVPTLEGVCKEKLVLYLRMK